MNAFQRHGIAHLSASSLNQFAASPASFVMERLLKRRSPMSAAVHRGSAVEAGVTHGLLQPDAAVEECQEIAAREYASLTALSGDPKRDKEGEAVPAIVASALGALRPYGIPDRVQERIERAIPGVPVSLLGFLDYGWTSHGMVIDLKTQLRLNSEVKPAHARQVAGYVVNSNSIGGICYATPQKVGIYRVEDVPHQWAAVCNIAKRLERFLSISGSAEDLAAIVVPDLDSFFFAHPHARANAIETFGPL